MFPPYFILCTGNSNTQVKALADEVEYKIGLRGLDPLHVEGRDNGSWVLIDYKTDFVPTGKAKQAASKHRRQLTFYRNALEALTGAKVKEMYIHFLGIGESVRID